MLACKLLSILDSHQGNIDEVKRCLLQSSVIDDDDYIWLRKSDIDSLLSAIHTTAVYLKEYVKSQPTQTTTIRKDTTKRYARFAYSIPRC